MLLSLCDILAIIYSKLVEDNSSSENVNIFQAIIRFDERIKVPTLAIPLVCCTCSIAERASCLSV